ncbi:TonB-dependent receptor [uncultured Draconibacterium sp.]|uniref:SusC/RagA family TonB-linked outer membrane protein n=1 Tax=uncultured Draconibacterium sp. TaxID=1573823 RepID=UPI00260071BA|nr:TonB-dependent receptor [uncultured Draconibacterium sp.]
MKKNEGKASLLGRSMILRTKITLLFVALFVMQGFSSVYSQTEILKLTKTTGTISEILEAIDRQSEFRFFYAADLFDETGDIEVEETELTMDVFLGKYIAPLGFHYTVTDRTVIIRKKTEEPAETKSKLNDIEETIPVKGVVSDDIGAPLPGVTVVVVGSTRGVITDIDGKFEIDVEPTAKLNFSFIGMTDQQIDVSNRSVINVTLQQKSEELDDITVVAFGRQKKESVLASISTIKTEDLKVPSSNLTTALAGRISGLISYQRSGEPGQDDASFFVRGVTSFSYASGPLILIDGVEMSSSDLARLQPDDIASFSIMKDAAATALYGARGANGVILVTTKEGKEGKATISFRYETSFSMPTQEVDLADPVTYMKMNNEAVLARNPLSAVPYSYEKIDNTIAGTNPYVYPATDWYNMLFKNYTINHRANFNVSGGGKVARYYIAGTYNQDNGVLKVDQNNNFNNNIDLKRYLLRSNVNINITKTTEAVVRLHGTFDDYTGPIDGGTSLYKKVMRSDPVLFPAYFEPDEQYSHVTHTLFGNYDQGQYINPYADMVKGYKDYSKSKMLAQFELKQDLSFVTEGLSIRGLFNTTRYSYFDVSRYYNPFWYSVASYDKPTDTYVLTRLNPEDGTEWLSYDEGAKIISSTTYAEAAINYDRTFEKHSVSGLLVTQMRNRIEPNASTLALSLPSRNLGLSGRFTYSYDSRYFTEFNFGYNGSERFAENERFGFFPSVGAAWIVSNEGFWNADISKIVNNLKLKATYGLVGNDAIGDANDRFFYLSEVNLNNSGRGFTWGEDSKYSVNGVGTSRYANDQITWEISKKLNTGIELGLFDKLNIQADFYTEHRTNILMDRADIPTTMGLQATPQTNVGEAKGKGIDLSADYQHSINNDFWITGRANFTYATSKFEVYEEVDNTNTPWLSHVGQPISQTWGYVAERLFIDEYDVINSPTQTFSEYMSGDIKYRDINGDGQINSLDKVPIGYPTQPEIVYGFGISTGYRNIDFSCFFQGLARESFWIDAYNTAPFIDTDGSSSTISKNSLLQVYADNHFSDDNPDIYALWPRLSDQYISNNTQTSTWFMRNGSFLRLKSVEFGYTLPKMLTEQIGITNLRFYFSGTNLLTFSKFKLWDPEMAGNGLGYPIQKIFNLGVQVSF